MIVEKYDYDNLDKVSKGGLRHYSVKGNLLPSVTTILSRTRDKKSVETLNNWKKRVGHENARRITNEAANVGTQMHLNLEHWIRGEEFPEKNNLIHIIAKKMANIVIENIKDSLDEVWGSEVQLYYPDLYAGTTDLSGVWKSNPAIMDFKQSNKPKKDEWVEDYKLQLVAYIEAHNIMFGTTINEGHVFVCTRDYEFQHFSVLPKEYSKYQNLWSKKIIRYYKL